MLNQKQNRLFFVFGFLLILVLFSTLVLAYWPMHGFNFRRTGFSSRPGPVTAELKWYYDLGFWYTHSIRVQDNASPVIGPDHTIYQISEHGLFAINPDGTLKWKADSCWGRLAAALSPDGTQIYVPNSNLSGIKAFNTEDGSEAWEFLFPEEYQDISYSSLAVDDSGTIYVATRLPASLYALNPNNTLKWSYTYPDSDDIGIEAAPAVGPDGSVYCIVNTIGLVALDSNGAFQWSNGDNCGWYGWPTPSVLADGTIVIAGDPGQGIIAFNSNGTKKWQRLDIESPGYFAGVAVSEAKGVVYTARSGGKMYALNAQTGTTKWSSTVTSGEEMAGSPALASNGVIYMMGEDAHLFAVRELDGALLWQYELNTSAFYWGPQSPALGPDGTLYAIAPGIVPAYGNIPARLYAFKSKDELAGSWSNGVWRKSSETGGWYKMASSATLIALGELDGDCFDDLIGIWPGQDGVLVKYSSTGAEAKLSATASHIASGDMNGDGRDDLLGTWDGQGVFYRNSVSGGWVKMATPATIITTGDIDGDRKDDLIGIWPTQGGVWLKSSKTGSWAKLSSTADDMAAGDMNGDGRDDLVGTWSGQGAFYRDSVSGGWVKISSPAEQVTAGDLDGDGKDDLIGLWSSQGGVFVKYSKTGTWSRLSTPAIDISAGLLKGGVWDSNNSDFESLQGPVGNFPASTQTRDNIKDRSEDGPGGWRFAFQEEMNLVPQATSRTLVTPGPGEPGFRWVEQQNLFPQEHVISKGGKRQESDARAGL
jgi:outer membrane protein assembly factor BamB